MEKHNEGLLIGFHSTWSLVQHGSAHHIRLHLTNLKTARSVCLHIAAELDHLIKLAELKLAEHESLERDVRGFEKACTGRMQ
jgi:deoxyribose-phosphate aldolase